MNASFICILNVFKLVSVYTKNVCILGTHALILAKLIPKFYQEQKL